MKIEVYLRRQSQEGTGHPLVLRDALIKAAARITDLEAAINTLRPKHYHCDDSYYCCPQCTHPDHDWRETSDKACTCGTAKLNETIDELLKAGEMNPHDY